MILRLRRRIFFVILQKPLISRLTLNKKERIKKQKDIELLFKGGQTFYLFPYKVFYSINAREPDEEPLLFGTGVGKRNFKKAVDRNRIKRLAREAFRTQKIPLKEQLMASGKQMKLFLIFTGREIPSFAVVNEKVQSILKKLQNEV